MKTMELKNMITEMKASLDIFKSRFKMFKKN